MKISWERVEVYETTSCAYPELIRARVGNGWLYAATNWNVKTDSPSEWSTTFHPDSVTQ